MCDQVAERLSGLISSPVRFADDCVGPSVRAQVEEMSDGEVSYTVNGCECTLLLSILANLVLLLSIRHWPADSAWRPLVVRCCVSVITRGISKCRQQCQLVRSIDASRSVFQVLLLENVRFYGEETENGWCRKGV